MKSTTHLGVALDAETHADKEFLVSRGVGMSSFIREAIREKAKKVRMYEAWESRVLEEALAQEEAARKRREEA